MTVHSWRLLLRGDLPRRLCLLASSSLSVCTSLPWLPLLLQAIGAAGAAALLSAVAARGRANARPSGKVTVLTHCNTGSLATAGYGTALGVVRALHEMGKLERCYACETRPYNQGEHSVHSAAKAAHLIITLTQKAA